LSCGRRSARPFSLCFQKVSDLAVKVLGQPDEVLEVYPASAIEMQLGQHVPADASGARKSAIRTRLSPISRDSRDCRRQKTFIHLLAVWPLSLFDASEADSSTATYSGDRLAVRLRALSVATYARIARNGNPTI